ncbi:kunitz-type serine protease inhibitor A-like isoform X2 [Anticarsia gemmatalis]|uniref:kunitz-type serine protease inhibitor A-like isoform X2 n=1 Tax=Anticarsia gemmatalis TaxID=129554 RepID=UPI003F758DCC
MFRKPTFMTVFLCVIVRQVLSHNKTQSGELSSDEETELKQLPSVIKCKLQANSYDCVNPRNETLTSWFYYDLGMKACMTFEYYECALSINHFRTLLDCTTRCRTAGPKPINREVNKNVYCRLQPDFGDCTGYHPMFYFDISTRTCRGFSYSGCGGNDNRFTSSQQCIAICNPEFAITD